MTKRFMAAYEKMEKIQKRLKHFSNLPYDDRENMQQHVVELEQFISDGLKDVSRMHKVIFLVLPFN